MRFLRARKMDIPKAVKMFSDYEQWRKEFDVEGIVRTFGFPEKAEVSRIYPRFYHKVDKHGRPVYFEILGKVDAKELFNITTIDRLLQYHVREYEKLTRYRLPACTAKHGSHIEQCCTILDLKGVRLADFNSVRKIVQKVSQIAQDYYPETLGHMFIINAPTLFTTVWPIVKGMLDPNTVSKISILGSSYEKELQKMIDIENIPKQFGGSCSCKGGCENGDSGPWNDDRRDIPGQVGVPEKLSKEEEAASHSVESSAAVTVT
ncbi:CRAL-TRIO domain-containing protein [Cladochytrium replicatum]|nr:CRAL-TRIO domain-containing protein [Cladochytrium replicatum]